MENKQQGRHCSCSETVASPSIQRPVSSTHPLLCSCPSLSRYLPPSWLHALPPSPSRAPTVLHGEDPKLTSANSKLLTAHPRRVSLVPSQASHTSRTTQTARDDTKSPETQSRSKRLQVQRCALRRGTNLVKPALAQSSAAFRLWQHPAAPCPFGVCMCTQMDRADLQRSSLSEGKLQATLQTRQCCDTHTHTHT